MKIFVCRFANIGKKPYLCTIKITNNRAAQLVKLCTKNMTTIATTIYNQLGGHKFAVMAGAKNMKDIENGLSFSIGANGSKANMVKVILDGDDTYTMQFVKKGREVNVCNIIMKYADKGMSESDFNAAVEVAINRANKSAEDKVLKECSGLYFHQLQATFTEYTKMYTRL